MADPRTGQQSSVGLDALPNELLDHILAFMDKPPPSIAFESDNPVKAAGQHVSPDLKLFSLVSKRVRRLTLPILFQYIQFIPKTLYSFLSLAFLDPSSHYWENQLRDELTGPIVDFLEVNSLHHRAANLLVDLRLVNLNEEEFNKQFMAWHQEHPGHLSQYGQDKCSQILRQYRFPALQIPSIIVLGASDLLEYLAGPRHCAKDAWAFDMPLQTLRFERDSISSADFRLIAFREVNVKPWTHLSLNEGSFIKAYSTYEYSQKLPPSIIYCGPSRIRTGHEFRSTLTSLTYTAIFPFANHVEKVLVLPRSCPKLESFHIQLAPSIGSGVLEDKDQMGKADVNDMWMELNDAYSYAVDAVVQMGRKAKLNKFRSLDYAIEGLDCDSKFKSADDLSDWRSCGDGWWIKADTVG